MNIEIANRLVNLRKEKGLSQEQLAEKIGVSRQAVSKWERSEASPDTDNLIMLARLYEVSLDELLRTEDEIPLPEAVGEESGEASPEEASGNPAEEETSEEAVISAEPQEPEGENPAPTEKEEENPAPPEKKEDRIRIGSVGIHFTDKNGNVLTVGKGGIHLSGGDPEIADKDRLFQEKLRRGLTFAAVAGLFLCGGLAYLSAMAREAVPFLLSLSPIPPLMAFLGRDRKAVRVLFTLAVIALSLLMVGTTGYRVIKAFGWLCLLLIPMYYRFIAFLRLHAERKKQGSPKPPPSAHPFCDFLTYHEKAIDLLIYALVWTVTVSLVFGHVWGSSDVFPELAFLCLIPVLQSFVQAVRERNPDRFSLEALLLFLLLFMNGEWRSFSGLMEGFPLLFAAPLYHWLCRKFMKRFAAPETKETETE